MWCKVKMWCKVQILLNSILNPCTEMRLPHSTWAARCSGSGSSRAPAPESPSCRADRVWRRSSRWTTSRCQNSTKEHLLFCVTKQTYIDKGIQVLQMKKKKVSKRKWKYCEKTNVLFANKNKELQNINKTAKAMSLQHIFHVRVYFVFQSSMNSQHKKCSYGSVVEHCVSSIKVVGSIPREHV